jgi:hypothetical protein
MNVFKWVAAGSIGGLIGALIWGAITYFLSAEIGWIAWGIGGLVGIGVRYGAGEEDEGAGPGVTAIAISAGAILLGKYFAAMMLVGALGGNHFSAEDMKLMIANEEREHWEAYDSWDQVPADVRTKAEAEWGAKSPEEQKALLDGMNDLVRMHVSTNDMFAASFSFFDILWFLLAAGTAFRLGSGTATDDD